MTGKNLREKISIDIKKGVVFIDFYKTPIIPSKPHPSLIKANTPCKDELTKKAMVLHNYTHENEDEIDLMRGEYVTDVDQLEDAGWWKGTNERGATGIFPSNYVQILEEATPPPRPSRARPPTIKTDKPQAPVIPVGTRPTSLLTKSEHNSSATPPPPRPTTLPPPRPTTSPPIPTSHRSALPGHKRTPSIPLLSPDLPTHDRSTTRSFFSRPTSIDEHSKVNQEALQNMAKPPKVNFSDPVVTPLRIRPISENQKNELTPPTPKRSMPPPTPTTALPSIPTDPLADEIRHLVLAETEKVRKDFERKLEDERIERLKLQVELEELKKHLYN